MFPARSLLLFPFFLILSPVASRPQQTVDLQAPVKAVVFEDDFEPALQQYSWSQWKGLNPCWTVRCSGNSALLQEDTRTVPRQVLYAPGKQWRDYGFTCRLRVQSWGGQTKSFAWSGQQYRQVYWAVALRVADAANGYRLEYAPWVPEERGNKQPYYKIVKYVGGVRTEIARVLASFHSDLDHLVRFEANGSTLRAKVWPAFRPEPQEWTISAKDSDLSAGTVGLITANVAMLFDCLTVTSARGERLLDEQFSQAELPGSWVPLSGSWKIAPWGKALARSSAESGPALAVGGDAPLPASFTQTVTLGDGGSLGLMISAAPGGEKFRLVLENAGVTVYQDEKQIAAGQFRLEPGKEYSLRLNLDPGRFALRVEPYPLAGEGGGALSCELPPKTDAVRFEYLPRSRAVSVDNLTLEATVPRTRALESYLRYICNWYMKLDLPSGYPKTGTGTPELFIASYCVRTLLAGYRILGEQVYLEQALRWADMVTTSDAVLVPLVTGKGHDALALRTFINWSACVNLADIGSVVSAVAVLYPWADSRRQARYLEVMEKYSLYVIEGCLEDPLILGRGNQPQGWRFASGPDKGAFANGYWWMEKQDQPWDVSTTNVGMVFYSMLYRLTGNPDYRTYASEAADWYLRREVDTGSVFESFHDVVYGGEALVAAWEYGADKALRDRIEAALGKICEWVAKNQKPDGTWSQGGEPKNNRTNLVWELLDWYLIRHPENKAVSGALEKTLAFHLDRDKSRETGVCEILRKTCFTGVSVAEVLSPGSTLKMKGDR